MSKYPLPAALAPASEKGFVTGDVVKCKAEALPKSLRGKEMQVIRQLFKDSLMIKPVKSTSNKEYTVPLLSCTLVFVQLVVKCQVP